MVDASGQALSAQAVRQAPDGFTSAIARLRRHWRPVLAIATLAALVALTLTWGIGWFYVMGGICAGGAAVVIAWRLSAALRTSEQNAAELMEAYTDAVRELDRRESSYRRRLHDARSATAGIRAAVEVMGARPASRIDDAQRLRWCILSELNRLQSLLDADEDEQKVDFDLIAALDPIVLAHRSAGTSIDLVADTARAYGRPHATSSVLDNLLRNVQLHAPGAHVQVRVTDGRPEVTVVVDDDGPGVPTDIADRVLLPGVRGPSAGTPGSGLGLHNALVAMTGQAGSLRLGPRPGGGTRVTLTLPCAERLPDHDSEPRLAG